MRFQCSNMDEALRAEEVPREAKVHAETCGPCGERLRFWSEISDIAPQLRRDWESPSLWPRIQDALEATAKHRGSIPAWRWALAAAAMLLLAVALFSALHREPIQTARQGDMPEGAAFLNAKTLRDVQKAEVAYVMAIDKLSSEAGTSLQQSSIPIAAMYREKLIVIDEAIADLKAGIETNQYNVYLQTQLASLYQEKQKTLEEWMKNANRN